MRFFSVLKRLPLAQFLHAALLLRLNTGAVCFSDKIRSINYVHAKNHNGSWHRGNASKRIKEKTVETANICTRYCRDLAQVYASKLPVITSMLFVMIPCETNLTLFSLPPSLIPTLILSKPSKKSRIQVRKIINIKNIFPSFS